MQELYGRKYLWEGIDTVLRMVEHWKSLEKD